jgi:hypothetical protein
MITKLINPFWIVVEVQSGIPTSANAFWDKTSAENYKKHISRYINPEDDEIAIFPIQIHQKRRLHIQRTSSKSIV